MLCLLLFVFFQTEDQEEPKDNVFKEAEISWRADHEKAMKADDSWLNLVGLFWLKEGANPFGAKYDLRIGLPVHSTVERAGVITLAEGEVSFEMSRGQRAEVNGTLRNSGPLALGEELAHNHLRMFVIERGGRLALRVRDLRARNFLEFERLDFYRPKDRYALQARFEAYEETKTINVTTVISTEIELQVPGEIVFELEGKEYRLIPTLETAEDTKWMVMFQDRTSGTTTYSGGRFLYLDPPAEDGSISLNFNRAVNPPCAYTVYATCPLPPSENWLDVAIEAGERLYVGHDE